MDAKDCDFPNYQAALKISQAMREHNELTYGRLSALSGNFDLSPVRLDAPLDYRRSKRGQRAVADKKGWR